MGKVDQGPYFREKGGSCSEKDYTSPLNWHPHLKNHEGWHSRQTAPKVGNPLDTQGRHITTCRTRGAGTRNSRCCIRRSLSVWSLWVGDGVSPPIIPGA